MTDVVFLNPKTCGIYKDGGARYKTDPQSGLRTTEIDNELIEHVTAYLADRNSLPPGAAVHSLDAVFERKVIVPTYYDDRLNDGIRKLLAREGLSGVTLGELIDKKAIRVRGGHGSPSNDQRSGHIPYVKVSDIRGLRININPTNLVSERVAERFWRGDTSKLQAWDLITPNRASANIGEFAVLLPGEERIVLTKEVYVVSVSERAGFDPFYLLWALSLGAVREQWRRVTLMQTNREDCGRRFREIIIPLPKSRKWADAISRPFRNYFTTIAAAKSTFIREVRASNFEHIANVVSDLPIEPSLDGDNAAE